MISVETGEFRLPPQSIRDAICRVTDPRFPIDLSAPVRLALTFLLRRVEASDGAREFWVRRFNFAEIAGRTEKTISNWLGELERVGLIAKEQRRTTWGSFRSLTVRLTDRAIALLGLDDVARPETKPNRKFCSHVTITGFQSKETGAGSSPPSPPLTEERLPPDLRSLVGPSMPVSAVLRLMGMATRSGKRLSDVVAACQASINKAKSPFAYIRALIGKDRDYAAIAEIGVQRKSESDGIDLRTKLWAAVAGTDVVRAAKVIRVGAVGEPCQVFTKLPDGRVGAYSGLLCGAELLRFIENLGEVG